MCHVPPTDHSTDIAVTGTRRPANLLLTIHHSQLLVLAAVLRGPVEYRAFWRAAASNWGVSWGDLRKDMAPPATG